MQVKRITTKKKREREVTPGKIKLPGDSIKEVCPFISMHLVHYDRHAAFKTDINSSALSTNICRNLLIGLQ